MTSLGCSVYTVSSSAWHYSMLFPSNLDTFSFFFFFLIVVARISNIMLDRSGARGHLDLFQLSVGRQSACH